MAKRLRLHLGRIEDELRDVQRHFPAINAVLNLRRDDFSDAVRQNMVTAYEFLDALVDEDLDLFSDEGLEALLQLAQAIIRDSKNGFGCRAGRASTWVAAARKTVRNSSVSVTFRDGRKLFLGSTGTGAPNPEDFPTENVRKEGKY